MIGINRYRIDKIRSDRRLGLIYIPTTGIINNALAKINFKDAPVESGISKSFSKRAINKKIKLEAEKWIKHWQSKPVAKLK